MAKNAREIVICVDMGMTGSAARWRDSKGKKNWVSICYEKIPTKVAYDLQDNNGPPIAWGTQCDALPSAQVKECFKVFMGETNFASIPDTVPGGPSSQLELHRWVRDYLGAFCADVVANIDRFGEPGWREATIIWNFTVPGSWADFPVVADFKRLAEDAVSSCFQNFKGFRIRIDVTEAMASAEFLLVEGSVAKEKEYSVGNTIISCDIGGATTDVAISTVSSAGRLTTWPSLQTTSAGVVTMEKAFWLHARRALRDAGVPNSDQLALEVVRSVDFERKRASFKKDQLQEHVIIPLEIRLEDQKWSPVSTPSIGSTTIKNGELYIHRDVFESFFTQFVQGIEAAIDEAINYAGEKKKHPSVIGFCGGGSRTLYAMRRFQRRYGDSASIIDPAHFAARPEMATVIGSTLLWDRKKLQEFISETSFGIETVDGIKWRCAEESLAPSNFARPYTWVVSFACGMHGSLHTHRIIATKSPPALPNKFSDALRCPRSKIWTLQVDLQKEKGTALSWKKKYQVICNIAGPWDIHIRAESLVDGKDIPCIVTGEKYLE